jgi:hypothetical protein
MGVKRQRLPLSARSNCRRRVAARNRVRVIHREVSVKPVRGRVTPSTKSYRKRRSAGVGNLHVGRSASNLQGETGWAGSLMEERLDARLLEGEKIAALFRESGWKLVGVDMPTPEEKEVWSQLEQLG